MHQFRDFGCRVGVFLVLLGAGRVPAQSPQWVTRFDDVAFASDNITGLVIDADGNGYLAGYNETGWTAWKVAPDGHVEWYWHRAGLARRDEEPRIAGLDASGEIYLVSGSSYGITIARVAADGQSATVRHHDEGRAFVKDATATADGDVFVTGTFESDPDTPADVFVARFNREGEYSWSTTYDGPASDYDSGAAIEIGPTGDVYVAGRAGYRSESTGTLRNGGLLLRYTPAGDLVWDSLTELDPNTQYETLYSATLAVDTGGNAYVAGWKSSGGQARGMIFKVAADGSPLWHDGPLDTLYTSNEASNPRVLLDEARGVVYFAGDVSNTASDSDFQLRQYSLDGSSSWTVRYDGPAHTRDNLLSAGLDAAGIVHLIGTSYAEADNPDLTDVQFDSNGQQVAVGRSDNEASPYDRVETGHVAADGHAWIVGGAFSQYFDSRVVRMNPGGQVEWSILLQSTIGSVDGFTDAAVDSSGGIYAVGTSDRQRSFENPSIIVRYAPDGRLEWQQRLPEQFRNPGAVAVDPGGNAVVMTEYLNNSSAPMGLLKYARDGTLLWSRNHAGPDRLVWLRPRMAMDAQGNLMICGWREYSNGYGYPERNAFVECIGGDGALRWSHEMAGSRFESFYALAVGDTGEVTVVGTSSETYDDTPNEIVTIRYGVNGFEQWQQRFVRPESTASDGPATVNLSADGTIYVTAARGDWRETQRTTVLCYSPDGELRWVRDFEAESGQSVQPEEARVDASGNLVILCDLNLPNGTSDVQLLSFAPDGELLWAHRHRGPRNFTELARMLEIGATGDLLVSAMTYPGNSYAYYNPMILRLEVGGVPRWQLRESQPGELAGHFRSLRALPDGGFLLAGQSFSSASRGDGVVMRFSPPPPACPGVDPCAADLNADCQVDLADLAIALSTFGTQFAEGFAPGNGDVDFDGDVDLQDLAVLLSAWGGDCR